MTRFIGLCSAKGGVGKTTSTINLASAFKFHGKDVTIVDGNLTAPNIGLHLGVHSVPIDLHSVLSGKHHIFEALYLHPSGLKIVPIDLSLKGLRHARPEKLAKALENLDGTTDLVLVDSAPGLGRETVNAIDSVNEILIVTNPNLLAMTDALRTVKVVEQFGKKILGIILTGVKNDGLDLSKKNIETMLGYQVLTSIPDDIAVRKALLRREPAVTAYPNSEAAVTYKRLAAAMLGRAYDERDYDNYGGSLEEKYADNKGLFYRVLKKLGWV